MISEYFIILLGIYLYYYTIIIMDTSFGKAEFNDKCKNQGYNENHICNISNFSKIIHHQAERKKSLIKQI